MFGVLWKSLVGLGRGMTRQPAFSLVVISKGIFVLGTAIGPQPRESRAQPTLDHRDLGSNASCWSSAVGASAKNELIPV
jgi:hypothetical protein